MSDLPEPQLLTVRQVAALLNIGTSSVWRHVRNGTLPKPVRIVGTTRWRRADLLALVDGLAA